MEPLPQNSLQKLNTAQTTNLGTCNHQSNNTKYDMQAVLLTVGIQMSMRFQSAFTIFHIRINGAFYVIGNWFKGALGVDTRTEGPSIVSKYLNLLLTATSDTSVSRWYRSWPWVMAHSSFDIYMQYTHAYCTLYIISHMCIYIYIYMCAIY